MSTIGFTVIILCNILCFYYKSSTPKSLVLYVSIKILWLIVTLVYYCTQTVYSTYLHLVIIVHVYTLFMADLKQWWGWGHAQQMSDKLVPTKHHLITCQWHTVELHVYVLLLFVFFLFYPLKMHVFGCIL